jgi:hypothetical protein
MSSTQPQPETTQTSIETRALSSAVSLIDPPPAAPRGRVLVEDLGIHIDRNGTWYYHGSAIDRKELVCLFASALTRDHGGGYWLVTPTEMGRISVEDAPLLAIEVFSAGGGRDRVISVRINTDEIITVDADHPLQVVTDRSTGEPSPYITASRGVVAKLTRAAYYDLVDSGATEELEGERAFGVWSAGVFFPLGPLDDHT